MIIVESVTIIISFQFTVYLGNRIALIDNVERRSIYFIVPQSWLISVSRNHIYQWTILFFPSIHFSFVLFVRLIIFILEERKEKIFHELLQALLWINFTHEKEKLNHLQIAKSLVSNMKSIATLICRRKKSSGIGSEISHLIKKMLRKILSNRLKLRPPRQKSGLGRETVRIWKRSGSTAKKNNSNNVCVCVRG